jgi:hypothetical protein
MQLREVTNRRLAGQFLDVARTIYRDDPVWVCPLDRDIEQVFDPSVNAYFKEGEAIRWILEDRGKTAGRIAAFYHRKRSARYAQPTGGVGFFECIDDRDAAFRLFDKARERLEEKGMQAMDGPVNFGENTNFWGLLTEGYTHPAFGMNYNPPFYKDLFGSYGFTPYFAQETRHLDLTKPFPERFWKIAEWTIKRPGNTFRHFEKKHTEKFIGDIKTIHDQAWQFHEHFTPLDPDVIRKELKAAGPILEEDLIWFVYHNGEPVAFMVMLPDANQILKYFRGKMNFLNKIRFAWLYHKKTITRTRVTILGVVPRFQGLGLESAIFWHLREPLLVKRPHIKEIEISWVADYNPKMQAILDALQAGPGKIHRTYRKLFTREEESHYSPVIPVDTRFRAADK